jgi:hypothetical protein
MLDLSVYLREQGSPPLYDYVLAKNTGVAELPFDHLIYSNVSLTALLCPEYQEETAS